MSTKWKWDKSFQEKGWKFETRFHNLSHVFATRALEGGMVVRALVRKGKCVSHIWTPFVFVSGNFTQRVEKWHRDNNLQYVGHVIEDNGLHSRFGHGAGHYFRAESGQTMLGIDIVMHQVMPGFADYNCTGRLKREY